MVTRIIKYYPWYRNNYVFSVKRVNWITQEPSFHVLLKRFKILHRMCVPRHGTAVSLSVCGRGSTARCHQAAPHSPRPGQDSSLALTSAWDPVQLLTVIIWLSLIDQPVCSDMITTNRPAPKLQRVSLPRRSHGDQLLMPCHIVDAWTADRTNHWLLSVIILNGPIFWSFLFNL